MMEHKCSTECINRSVGFKLSFISNKIGVKGHARRSVRLYLGTVGFELTYHANNTNNINIMMLGKCNVHQF